MHPSFEEVVPKRTTRKRFKNGDCEWSFPDEVETFSCQVKILTKKKKKSERQVFLKSKEMNLVFTSQI